MKLPFPLATLAGVLTWLLVSGITLLILQRLPGPQPWLPVVLLLLLYGGCFIFLTQESSSSLALKQRYGHYLLAVQLASAFGLLWVLPTGHFDYLAILTIIWVSLLPHIMSQYKAILLAAVVVVIWFSLQAVLEQRSLWISASLFGSFHLFAIVMQSAILAEQQAKLKIASQHQQLQAAQHLLLAASRQGERHRIARDLHDLLGHHLTALTIQLEVARHHSDGEARLQVEKSLQLAKLLLSDVREAVSSMRDYADLSLAHLLEPILADLPAHLNIELTIPADLTLPNISQAQHVMMLVQEAVSNTLKHTKATTLSLSAEIIHDSDKAELLLCITDNGMLADNWRLGNGLTGMQERVAECHGQLNLQKVNGALQLQIRLPQEVINA
ncbi:histidine kinase [Alishewanella sp. 16-MA]|uniref:Histidine kinase n=1 Tax=Alishewanella maricola TaxID=2795740 RepID=A0ABS8C1A3_9ALTE|nr:histidine kinase [Alishewanella maricola]MCB5226107.1 histidine kinase [Alishewanella maricola]